MKPPMHHSILKFLCIIVFSNPFPFLQAQWISQTGNTPENIVDVVTLDSLNAIAVGDRNGILRTTDAGATWVNQTIALSAIFRWNKISFFDAFNGAIAGDHRVMTTTDGGFQWKIRPVPASTQLCLSIIQTGPASIEIGTDSGWVYHSADTGSTWISEKVSSWPIRTFFAWHDTTALILSNNSLLGVSNYALTPYSICTQYVIPPPSWHEDTLPFFRGLGSEAYDAEFCRGGGSGFIVGVFGDLWSQPAIVRKLSTDTAWENLSTSIMGSGPLLGVSAPSANVIYVCGSGGRIYKTLNGGNTWRKLAVPTTRNLNAVYFYDENRGFAVGDSGVILYTSNGGEVAVSVKEKENIPAEFALNQNYPNPFNPNTVISYQLSAVSNVNLKIYNILGREVANLVNQQQEPGAYQVTIDARKFASGMYVYRLIATDIQNNHHVFQKKMLMLK